MCQDLHRGLGRRNFYSDDREMLLSFFNLQKSDHQILFEKVFHVCGFLYQQNHPIVLVAVKDPRYKSCVLCFEFRLSVFISRRVCGTAPQKSYIKRLYRKLPSEFEIHPHHYICQTFSGEVFRPEI